MIQVALNDFAENVYEYIESLNDGDITLTKDGKDVAVVAVVPEREKSWVEKYSGIISLPDDFDLKEFKHERLREKYESLN